MNSSGNRNSKGSPGFIYFNPDFKKAPSDNQNFLSFEESPNYSYNNSPNSYKRHSYNNYETPKFHSSPRHFDIRNTYRYSGGSSRGNRSFHSPKNFNKSWTNQRNQKQHKQNFNNSPMVSRDGSRDMSMFYDHTCTENPWAELEKELEMENAKELEIENPNEEPPGSQILEKVNTVAQQEQDEAESSSDSEEGEGGEGSSSSSSTSSSGSSDDEEIKETT